MSAPASFVELRARRFELLGNQLQRAVSPAKLSQSVRYDARFVTLQHVETHSALVKVHVSFLLQFLQGSDLLELLNSLGVFLDHRLARAGSRSLLWLASVRNFIFRSLHLVE